MRAPPCATSRRGSLIKARETKNPFRHPAEVVIDLATRLAPPLPAEVSERPGLPLRIYISEFGIVSYFSATFYLACPRFFFFFIPDGLKRLKRKMAAS